MATESLILVGGGEHARVVADAAHSSPGRWTVLGFVDPLPCAETSARSGLRRLGDDDALEHYPRALAVLGFGGLGKGEGRVAAVNRASKFVRGWASIVHERAWVSPTAVMGPGAVVMAGAIVQTGAKIGAHAIINSGAVVEHDVVVGDFAQISPGAIVGGGCRIGRQAFVGLGAALRDHVEIGEESIIGMGAVVVGDVKPGTTVRGIPARTRQNADSRELKY